MYDKYNKKILDYKDKNYFIVFYSPSCKFSVNAITLLETKNISFKGYNIDNIKGNRKRLLHFLKQQKDITSFDEQHKTIPIIFYKGKFIGGFSELESYLNNLKI